MALVFSFATRPPQLAASLFDRRICQWPLKSTDGLFAIPDQPVHLIAIASRTTTAPIVINNC
jgi:hypothetical protein